MDFEAIPAVIGYIIGLLFWLACAAIGAACGRSRGRETAGFWLGLLLGPLGCVIALFLPGNTVTESSTPSRARPDPYVKRCGMCGKITELRARTCPDCGSELA